VLVFINFTPHIYVCNVFVCDHETACIIHIIEILSICDLKILSFVESHTYTTGYACLPASKFLIILLYFLLDGDVTQKSTTATTKSKPENPTRMRFGEWWIAC